MKLLVIILRRTLTRCYRPPTITATDWASALQSIPGRSIIRPVCISHIAHTAIGHMPIGTGSTVRIVGTGARQPISYYGMLNGTSLSPSVGVRHSPYFPGVPEKPPSLIVGDAP